MNKDGEMKRRLPELDGLRGIAALSVLMAHYTPATLASEHATTPYLFNWVHTFSLANIGVLIFFGLSSFLLTWIAEEQFLARGSFNRTQFVTHRFFRIVPLYAAVVLITLLVLRDNGWFPNFSAQETATRGYSIHHIWIFALFLYNWADAFIGFNNFHPSDFNELGHLWTLSVEVQFYLLFAVFFTVFRRFMGKISVFIWATVAVGILVRILFLSIMALGSTSHPAGYLYFYTGSYLEVFLLSSAAGILFARREQSPPLLELVRRPGVGIAIVLLLAVLGWVWKFFLWSPAALATPMGTAVFYSMAVILYSAMGLTIAVSLLWLAANRNSLLSRFLKLPLLQAFGTLSYGIYMWHLPAKFALFGFDKRMLSGLEGDRRLIGVLLMFMIYLAFVIALAGVTFWAIEAPASRFRRILDSKKERFDKAAGLGQAPSRLVLLASGVGCAAFVAILLLR